MLVKEEILPKPLLSTVVLTSYFAAASPNCSYPSTPTRCGSRPGSSSATASEGAPMRRKNGFYVALAVPGCLWLLLLFIVPFYAVLAIAMGKLDRLFESPVAVWNP